MKVKDKMPNTNELHAFIIGFFEVLCPWPSRYRIAREQWDEVIEEFHYYMAGRGFGFIILLLILIGIAKLVLEVLL